MNKSWKLIPLVVSGKKSIESRWYVKKIAPWGMIKAGDTVFFKDSGELVTAKAKVVKVRQFHFRDISETAHIIEKYGKRICLVDSDFRNWKRTPKYCILLFLKKAKWIKIPFNVDKRGFGSGAAWLTIKNIRKIKKVIPPG